MTYVMLVLPIVGIAAAALAGPLRRRSSERRKWSSAGGVVLNELGQIAIVQQRDRKRRLRWTLPKGRIDAGETPELAALREVHEETGLRARIVRPLLLHEGQRHFTYYYEMALEGDDGVHDRETIKVKFVPVPKAARVIRSRRDLAVLRRVLEVRTRVQS
jgi:8-oxo-dGTP pyrophosphatase MutT (NUDIX family)